MNTAYKNSPLAFFELVVALSIPFWVIGAFVDRQLLPALPISALGFLCPLAAAVILIYRRSGLAGVGALFKRSFDFDQIRAKIWLVPALLLEPGIMILSYVVIRMNGEPIPLPQFSLLQALTLFVVFFIAGLCEELGWSGYVTDPLQNRYGALRASLLIGVVWVAVHLIPLLQAQRSVEFITWWSVGTIAYRIIIVWLYNNTGRSVFMAAIFHAMINLTWQLFPVNGSFYDPLVTSLIAAIVAAIVVIIWGPETLTRRKSPLLGRATE